MISPACLATMTSRSWTSWWLMLSAILRTALDDVGRETKCGKLVILADIFCMANKSELTMSGRSSRQKQQIGMTERERKVYGTSSREEENSSGTLKSKTASSWTQRGEQRESLEVITVAAVVVGVVGVEGVEE